jgi:putative pyoverdin transport system ATP-binding/permease protein
LYSIVFTDFHLFKRLYGLHNTPDQVIKNWLEVMELDKKTRYENQGFTNTSLSTGQKKRLAFITAVLKNRPICIFDELAADQDPGFRQRFYAEILPELQQQGRTVIVVSHDDQFFHLADRILKLEDGKVLTDNIQHETPHPQGTAA